MKLFLSVFFLFVFGTVLFAQTTITGYVKDAKTGSPLNGVDVVVVGKPFGTVTNIHERTGNRLHWGSVLRLLDCQSVTAMRK